MSMSISVSGKGEFKRAATVFRNFIRKGGDFPPEAGRYHLYLSLACPWACRALAVRQLKGLTKAISVSVVDWFLGESGWRFSPDRPGCTTDEVNGFSRLREVYEQQDPNYNGRVTVPVLYDKQTKKIVNNESSEIIRMLNSQFNELSETAEERELDLYPKELRAQIDEVNEWVYDNINNGVYKCGFAQTQEAYDTAFKALFDHLDRAEAILSRSRYLCGDVLTEADIRLFVSLIRFDAVYVGHFKCNLHRIIDYPNLFGFTRELYQHKKVHSTVNLHHIKFHYMQSHLFINPYGIVSNGPDLSMYEEPHDRSRDYSSVPSGKMEKI